MKKIKLLFIIAVLFTLGACSDWLDMNPKDKLTTGVILNPEGIQLYMANLYFQMPIEDFRSDPGSYSDDPYADASTFNSRTNNGGRRWSNFTDESNGQHQPWPQRDHSRWWVPGYKLLHDVNYLLSEMPNFKGTEAEIKAITAEAHFIKAYTYYALVSRYGGICLIDELQPLSEDIETLKVPRSTEYDSWKAVMDECDLAIAGLGEARSRRANKYAAAALKSRAALHAASVMKFWNANNAQNTGQAIDEGLKYNGDLPGRNSTVDADYFYDECIKASNIVIASSYSLYKPFPADPAEAIKNIQGMFIDCNVAPEEVIFTRGFTLAGTNYAHDTDIWFNPFQNNNNFGGRMHPLLDLAEAYELYSRPGILKNPFITMTTPDGYESPAVINGRTTNNNITVGPVSDYIYFEKPYDLFAFDATPGSGHDRDARFYATYILPGETWKDVGIIIKAGNISSTGESSIYGATDGSVTYNGTVYNTYGALSSTAGGTISGFWSGGAEYTQSGFLFKKFLSLTTYYAQAWRTSTSDWPDMRYAEVLLNYMEAAYEKSTPDPVEIANALTYLNDIRRRAAHTTEITPAQMAANGKNIIKRERRIELAFENKRSWDLIRRRDLTEGGEFYKFRKYALAPVQDFRPGADGKWMFIRTMMRNATGEFTTDKNIYYKNIDGQSSNGVVQN